MYKIADLVSNMTIMLMKNGKNGDERIRNGLSRKIDIEPNKNMTRKNFIFKIVTDMCNSGNCVIFPRYSGENLENLEFIDGCSFNKSGSGYIIQKGGNTYSPDEVLHFTLYPDSDKPFKGRGIAPLLKDVIETLSQSNATKKGFLKSKWKPSLIIAVSGDSDELEDKEKRELLLNNYTSTTEAGTPWLIPSGEIDVKTVQPLTLKDLAVQEGIEIDVRTIACAIGVPPFMVGIGKFDENEYNNFVSTIIMSFATIIHQELTKKILYSPDYYFKFNPKSLMQYKLADRVEFVKSMASMGMLNKNEGRNEFDYSPVDQEGMNDYTVLENYLKVEDLSKQKKLNQNGKTNKIIDEKSGGDILADGEPIAQISLNGAQIQSLLQIVQAVVAKQLEYSAAVTLITSAFPFDETIAKEILGDPSKLVQKGGEE